MHDNTKEYQAKKTIVNNLKCIKDDRFCGKALRAKFILKRLSYHGYGAEQNLIVSMILNTFESSSKYDEIRAVINREWREDQKKKDNL